MSPKPQAGKNANSDTVVQSPPILSTQYKSFILALAVADTAKFPSWQFYKASSSWLSFQVSEVSIQQKSGCLLTCYHLNCVSVSATQGQSLTSSEPVVNRAGQSVTLSCKVEGLSLAWLHWIRQKSGKGLEWIGRINDGTGTIFSQSLQGQFSITKDTSQNLVYLEVKSLKAEDSAVYYCAREPQWHRRLQSCTKTDLLIRNIEACQDFETNLPLNDDQ